METHNIHDEKINFHSGTSDARDWMKHGLSRDGLKSIMEKARGGSHEFRDVNGEKFEIKHDTESDTFSVHKKH